MEKMQKRIFIIDPSRTLQILLSTHLKQLGHQVVMSGSPAEALPMLVALKEVPDVILLTLDTEKKEAYKLVRYVKKQTIYAQTHLVALVHKEEQAAIQRTLGEERVSYLPMPFQVQQVLALVSAPRPEAASSDPQTASEGPHGE
jgi:CheY-like chemotaxis protein